MHARTFLGAVVLLAFPARIVAQPPPAIAIVVTGEGTRADGERRARIMRVLTETAARMGTTPVFDVERWSARPAPGEGDTERSRVLALTEVEGLLLRARADTAALREQAALGALARALTIAETQADVEGASAWIAEVHLTIGLVAAQAGLEPLVSSALRHAVTLDPTRVVRAAETNPDVLASSAAIARAVSSGPTGSFEVHADAQGAVVYLDDVELGAAPRRVRTSVGRHALRISAPGVEPWGKVIDVLEGERPAYRVRLAPSPAVIAARALERAAEDRSLDATSAAFSELVALRPALSGVWIVQLGTGREDRALLVACGSEGCTRPARLRTGHAFRPPRMQSVASTRDVHRELAEAQVWLDAEAQPSVQPSSAWWERWYVWTAVGVGAAAVIASAAYLFEPEREQRFRALIDIDELGTPEPAAVH